MKKTIQLILALFLLTTLTAVSGIEAVGPELLGIINLTNGDQRAGSFDLAGVVHNDGSVKKVAVKVGNGPWEAAVGVAQWSCRINLRQVVTGTDTVFDSALGKLRPIYRRGPVYGDLRIAVGAFDANGTQIIEKTVNIEAIPEKPYSVLTSGEYDAPFDLTLQAADDLKIYYTTDGSDPTSPSGIEYTGKIHISQNTIVKAVSKSISGQYSEIYRLDFIINNSPFLPIISIQYYQDEGLTCPLPDQPALKAGTYYIKVVSNIRFYNELKITIAAPGSLNDVTEYPLTVINDHVYYYRRTVLPDTAADGMVRESISFRGIDYRYNTPINIVPVNETAKAAYLDTQPPSLGSIELADGSSVTNDPRPTLIITSTGAAEMRLALSETGLLTAPWVKYTTVYDQFDISSDGNGIKTIWVQFRDRAGNVQSQPASTTVSYSNSLFSYDLEYFSDPQLLHSLGTCPYLKEGTYYLKITTNQDLNINPKIRIDAEGSTNDVSGSTTERLNSRTFYFTRKIIQDDAAVGLVKEHVTIEGVTASNIDADGAFTDTETPEMPIVTGLVSTENRRPLWSWSNVAGASRYRYSFSDGVDWLETFANFVIPENNLEVGSHTLFVQAGDQAGNWSASASFTITIVTAPEIYVKQGAAIIPAGTGSYHFGNVSLELYSEVIFEIANLGTGNLTLTGSPKIAISGANAAEFRVTAEPDSVIPVAGSTTFTVRFAPASTGLKTAIISIVNDDNDQSPYNITITGAGIPLETLSLGVWTPGDLETTNQFKYYRFNANVGSSYYISWDDRNQGSGTYSGDIKVSAYGPDLKSTYFSNVDSGYANPRMIMAADNVVYLKVAGSTAGTFALKVTQIIPKAVINLKTGTTNIPNGSGSCDFGMVPVRSTRDQVFIIENNGTGNLNLTGDPKIEISGANATEFSVVGQPYSPVAPSGDTSFKIRFAPASTGPKLATISISNNDSAENPYVFAITGAGEDSLILPIDTWTEGNIDQIGDVKVYSLITIPEKTYSINWDDCFQGTGTYTGNVTVSGYRQDLATAYFTNVNSGYTSPRIITAEDGVVYFKVTGNVTGSFALKASEIIPGPPLINVKQGNNHIPNGTGSFNFPSTSIKSTTTFDFTIENTGTTNLLLTGNPKIHLEGLDAADFMVYYPPASPVLPYNSTSFAVMFAPNTIGTKTAKVCISNNDTTNDPYVFTISGTATVMDLLPLDSWTPGNMVSGGDKKTFQFNSTIGKAYAVAWDESGGSGIYNGQIQVSAYHQDLIAPYFAESTGGYSLPRIIIAEENSIYIQAFGNVSGSYAIKIAEVTLGDPAIRVKQGNVSIPAGTGSFNFGELSAGSVKLANFIISNTGQGYLNLTGNPKIQLSGANAGEFSIVTQPKSPIIPNEYTVFALKFVPTATGVKTATVSISNDDPESSSYEFTITGTATPMKELPVAGWIQGELALDVEIEMYRFDAIEGKNYQISWDDAYQGSGSYTGDVKVSAYQEDLTAPYFNNLDSGYATPPIITAQGKVVYLKVAAKYAAGTFALKVTEIIP